MSEIRFRSLDFLGYPGYEVGTDGSVWGLPQPGRRTRRRIKPSNVNGYQLLKLYRDGKAKQIYVHQLVLLAFVGPCPPGMECRHLNGAKSANDLGNLIWGTPLDNAADKLRHGTVPRGEKHHLASLTEEVVLAIRAAFEAGEGKSAIARRLGISYGAVSHVLWGRSWTHLPICDQQVHEQNAPKGQRHYKATLKDEDVRAIRIAIAAGETQDAVAARFGSSQAVISRIINRKRWAHVD